MINTNITIFSQIIHQLPRDIINSIIKEFKTDKHSKGINTWTQFVTMIFHQFSRSRSIRETTNTLLSFEGNLNHLGILKKAPKKSSLSYLNKVRNCKVFEEIFNKLEEHFSGIINHKREKEGNRKKFKIKVPIYILDSSLLPLCASIFDWAHYKRAKGAVKLHLVLDYNTDLPRIAVITEGKKSDVKTAEDDIDFSDLPKGSVLIMDRGYESYNFLHKLDNNQISFVVRIKKTTGLIGCKERELPKGKDYILIDEKIKLENKETREKYPKELRHITMYIAKDDVTIEVLTNNFTWTAETICNLYKCRWQIESFFKCLKQNLKITSFLGTTANAVFIQIWTALITIMLIRFLKALATKSWAISNLISFLQLHLLVKVDLKELLNNPYKPPGEELGVIQMTLYDKIY